jgi:hypothetical protein
MSELKRLEKNVVDTKAAYAAGDAAWVRLNPAYDDYFKAKRELNRYLKEQQGNE